MRDEMQRMRTARRSKALMRSLSTDFLLREQFVTDPAGMFLDYTLGGPIVPEAASTANQLLYAIVSDRRSLAWLHRQASTRGQTDLSYAALGKELAIVAGHSGDAAISASLIRAGSSKEASIELALDLIRNLIEGLKGSIRSDGTEATPGTGTQFTPGTGTQFTPGTGTQFTPGTGTQATPGTGTQATPGTGTQFTPGTGTQATPGTGTQATPGTGTQSTPGGLVGRWGIFESTILALVEYAMQLRQMGALMETGFAA